MDSIKRRILCKGKFAIYLKGSQQLQRKGAHLGKHFIWKICPYGRIAGGCQIFLSGNVVHLGIFLTGLVVLVVQTWKGHVTPFTFFSPFTTVCGDWRLKKKNHQMNFEILRLPLVDTVALLVQTLCGQIVYGVETIWKYLDVTKRWTVWKLNSPE